MMTPSERMKQSSYINSYFSSKQFSGHISQSIALTFRDYYHCALLYNLDDASMATNFASALADPARAYFLSNVQPGMSFSEIEKLMNAEYNSNSRQIQFHRLFASLRIDEIKEEKNLSSHQETLKDIIQTIDKLVPQCPPTFRSGDNKINFLRKAVIGQEWAKLAIANVDSGDVSWGQFTTNLHAAMSLRKEMEETEEKKSFYNSNQEVDESNSYLTRYA